MKLGDARSFYQEFSGKVSDLSRQLSFAALGVVWIFNTNRPGVVSVPHYLLLPASFAVATLSLDILQYIYASAAWGLFGRHMEKRHDLNESVDFYAPRWLNWPTIFFFYAKIVTIVVCYASLLSYMFYKLWK